MRKEKRLIHLQWRICLTRSLKKKEKEKFSRVQRTSLCGCLCTLLASIHALCVTETGAPTQTCLFCDNPAFLPSFSFCLLCNSIWRDLLTGQGPYLYSSGCQELKKNQPFCSFNEMGMTRVMCFFLPSCINDCPIGIFFSGIQILFWCFVITTGEEGLDFHRWHMYVWWAGNFTPQKIAVEWTSDIFIRVRIT